LDGDADDKLVQSQLSFKFVKCLGHLRCLNPDCPHLTRTKNHNDLYWEGSSPQVLILGRDCSTPSKCTIVYHLCKATPVCFKLCLCKMFYIVSKDPNMSRAAMHFGAHGHPMADGECREVVDIIRQQIITQVARTPNAKSSAIGMAVGKELLLKGLLDEDGNGRKLTESELVEVFEKWSKLGSNSVRNLIVEARRFCRQGGYIDNILKFKRSSTYDYIHNSIFPGQGSDLVYLFKMSTCGQGSRVSLVRRMQPGGDLENEWVMFDHVKRIKEWTTMGVHMYDPEYRKVMTIVVCDMQLESSDAQQQL
jgi:hypothetical protein